jgi:hypothetical protein
MENLVTIPEIIFKSTLLSHVLYEATYTLVLGQLIKIPNIAGFKFSPEFTALVCNTIENTIKNNKVKDTEKVDKKKLVIALLTVLFNLSVAEQLVISNQIEYILENKLVKRVKKTVSKKIYKSVSKLFKKK